jgi:hypothetical protein
VLSTSSTRSGCGGGRKPNTLIAPGYIRTEMTCDVCLWPLAEPEVIVRAVLRVLRRPCREMVVPSPYRLVTWIEWFAPGLMDVASKLISPCLRVNQ